MSVIAILIAALSLPGTTSRASIDTPSAHYDVAEGAFEGRSVRALLTGPTGAQSAIYTDGSDELVFWYSKEVMKIAEVQQPSSILVLGGGAFTLPAALANKYSDADIDVVEIDPELGDIAEEFFEYRQAANVTHYYGDARTFVNQAEKKYDLIMVDVYGDTAIPFQLMTREYGDQVADILSSGGIVVANVITALRGPCQDLTEAVLGSYQERLPHVSYTTEQNDVARRANYLMIFSRTPRVFPDLKELPRLQPRTYSDNFMPAEQLHQQCRAAQIR